MLLDDWMTREDVTSSALGREIGTSPQAANRYRKGSRFPRLEHIDAIEKFSKGAVTVADHYQAHRAYKARRAEQSPNP